MGDKKAYLYFTEEDRVSEKPYSYDDLNSLFEDGAIDGSDLVHHDGEWKSLSSLLDNQIPSIDGLIAGLDREFDIACIEAEGLENDKFTNYIKEKQPVIYGVIGGGVAGVLSIGVLKFLSNPATQSALATVGVEVYKHWEELVIAHDLISFLGWQNTLSLLDISKDVVLDNLGFLSQFIDYGELTLDVLDSAATAGVTILVGLAITKYFEDLNREQQAVFDDLTKARIRRAQMKTLLDHDIPPSQLAQFLKNAESELIR
jgi:hypothetical protein